MSHTDLMIEQLRLSGVKIKSSWTRWLIIHTIAFLLQRQIRHTSSLNIYIRIYIFKYISKINCISEQSLEKKKENTYISSADGLASRPRVHLEGSDAKLGMNVVNQRYFEGPWRYARMCVCVYKYIWVYTNVWMRMEKKGVTSIERRDLLGLICRFI